MTTHPKASATSRSQLPALRALTENERELTAWIINNGGSEAREDFLSQLRDAVVARHCPCGCDSIDFHIPSIGEPTTAGLTILGDYVYGSDASGLCGAFVFAKGDILSGLEVYSLDGKTTPKLPKPSELRPH